MYHSILVPLDGSHFAEQALPLALEIAYRAAANLEVMQVYDRYVIQDPHCSWLPFDVADDAMCEESVQAYLDTITTHLAEAGSVSVTSALVGGMIVDGILGRVQTTPTDLIVMTTHGRGAASRLWLGSIADELVRQTPVPILLVRPREAAANLGPEPALKRILIPLDGSKLAECALAPTIALGSLVDAEYTLLRAVEPDWFPHGKPRAGEPKAADPPRLEKRKAEAQAYLDGVAERFRPQALSILTRVVVGESISSAILAVARTQNIDLIAIATHGRGGLKRLLLGSIADKIVRSASMPVLIYRPTAKN